MHESGLLSLGRRRRLGPINRWWLLGFRLMMVTRPTVHHTTTDAAAVIHLLAFLVAVATGGWGALAFDLGRCQTALGMQTGDILNSALRASSSMDPGSTGPENARIRSEIKGGAWCPKQQIQRDVYEFLEVDLGGIHVISLVETQGRFGNGQGQEYTEQFRLEYQREPDGKWFRFRNRRGQEIIQGNTNTHTAEMRDIQPPIIARKVRFVPHSTHAKTVCLRVELYGCLWLDGIVAYDMPQGEQRGLELHFADATYDGVIDNEYLSGGLGQFVDGEEGQSNFRVDPLNLGMKGYNWIGWKNESYPNGFVDIVFKFDGVRNFTSVSLHCNNMFSRDVRVFSMARVYFSGIKSGERVFDKAPLEFYYAKDDLIEYARPVKIQLENGIGQFVKIQLTFETRWIMISEVQFVSDLIELDHPKTRLISSAVDDLQTVTSVEFLHQAGNKLPINNSSSSRFLELANTSHNRASESSFLFINVASNANVTDNIVPWNVSRLQNKNMSGLDDEAVVVMITVLVVVVFTLCAIIIVIAFKRSRYNCVHHKFPAITKGSKSASSVVGDGSSSSYGPQLITFSQTSGLLQQNTPDHSYLTPSCHQDSDEPELSDTTSPLIVAPLCVSPYATADVLNLFSFPNREQSGRFCTLPQKLNHRDVQWTDFPQENLKFLRSLGREQSREVYLCELVQRGPGQQYGTHSSTRTLTSRRSPRSTLVAVKVVEKNASDQAREEFQREAAAMSRLNDPNIVRLMGVSTTSDACYFVLEYPQHGNLKEFLQNHVIEGTIKHDYRKTLSYGCLIYMASQIASGMKFLESSNLVHRDLAARNCLVGDDYTVKVSDFGNGDSQYPQDYYATPGSVPLPVRWMAWEALRLSNFSAKSDIWSFAVTVWEMLTFARQPYESLTDEQVIINSNHLLQSPGLWVALDQPVLCPREVYDLLCHCWSRDKSQRPTFHEVHMFLQRKNAGYHPSRERSSTNGHPKASVSLFV